MRDKSYFISDLHLGANYIADNKAHEAKIVGWLENIAPHARHLFLLGDVMDYWYEYRYVAPRGFVRFLGTLARMSDAGVEIVWLKGNHDIWIFDYLPEETGIKIVDGIYQRHIDGKLFVMEHGDGVGKIAKGYKMMRGLFRNSFAQWLYASIHPRWTIAFAKGWSTKSRTQAPEITEETVRAELKRLTEFAASHNAGLPRPADFYIFGHLHTPIEAIVDDGRSKLLVLGDAFKKYSYAEWDGKILKLSTIK